MATIDERLLHTNRHGAVAVPGVLWLAMAFLCRYWIVVAVVIVTARRSPDSIRLLGQDFSWFMLALELPAIAVILAGTSRNPQAGGLWRAVWAHGRAVLIGVAVAHLAVTAAALAATDVWRRWPELFLASCAVLDLAIVIGLARDVFFRELFADFPARAAPAGKP